MRNTWIIARSEFWRRVRSKWFVFTTLLGPLVLALFIVLPPLLVAATRDDAVVRIAVLDETGVLRHHLEEAGAEQFVFVPAEGSEAALRDAVLAGAYNGVLLLPASLIEGRGEATYSSAGGSGISLPPRLQGLLSQAVVRERLAGQGVPPHVLQIVGSEIVLRTLKLSEDGEEDDATLANSVLGYGMSFLVYITLLIYGGMVLQAVIEEKSSRVVEVMMASVRPFDLLMGKVLGIGAVGLAQMSLWAAMIAGLSLAAGSIVALVLDPGSLELPAEASRQALLARPDIALPNIPAALYIWFVLYFLGGYLLFASAYAAIGSAVEQQQDAQGAVTLVTFVSVIPVLLLVQVIDSPNAVGSIVVSMVPFFSPILMVVRLAVTDVPFWQVATSYLLLLASFVGSIWISSRIYRVGILRFGAKASLRDMIRWARTA